MARRADLARFDAARREATRSRLIGAGMLAEKADALIAAWDAEAARDGRPRDSTYWTVAWEWIDEQGER